MKCDRDKVEASRYFTILGEQYRGITVRRILNFQLLNLCIGSPDMVLLYISNKDAHHQILNLGLGPEADGDIQFSCAFDRLPRC